MAAPWKLVPCLIWLRAEFDTCFPQRDKASDGSKGDNAHAQRPSDHNPDESGKPTRIDADKENEVHAIDVDSDLRRAGWSMHRAVSIIVERHRTGKDDRLQNIIYDRTIWSESTGWNPRPYTLENPHNKHAHFGAKYVTALESNVKPWGILAALKAETETDDMPLSKDLIPVTKSALPLFEKGTKEGEEFSAATYLLLAALYAQRATVAAGQNAAEIVAIKRRLDDIGTVLAEIHAILNEPGPPPGDGTTRPETTGR